MAVTYFTTNNLLFTLILTLIITNLNAQNNQGILEPKCDSNSIKYSIVANLSEYLFNEKNIDGKEMFDYEDAISKLKNKKIGTIKELYFDRSKFNSIQDYDSYEELVKDLQKRKLDAIVLNDGQANKTQTLTEDLSRIENEAEVIQHAFGFQKDNTTLLNPFNDLLKDTSFIEGERIKWKSVNYQTSIDKDLKDLSGEKGTINALFRLKNQPYAYKLAN